MKKTIKDLELNNKKVILRVDFNVPISNGKIMDMKRIDAALPTIKYILDKNASIILLSHLGRVKTEEDKKDKSLNLVAQKLAELLPNNKVIFIKSTKGADVQKAAKQNQKTVLNLQDFELHLVMYLSMMHLQQHIEHMRQLLELHKILKIVH